jgi:hypothetical protein
MHTDPQRLRSTCPWVIETDVNENRYPKNVYNARCLCRRCIGSSSRYQCEPIYSNIIVIRLLSCHHGLLRVLDGHGIFSDDSGSGSIVIFNSTRTLSKAFSILAGL